MNLIADEIERRRWIAKELLALAKRKPKNLPEWWGDIADYARKGETEQKRVANAFLLACLLDYRRSEKNDNPAIAVSEFFKRNPGFRDEVWRKIYETPKDQWNSDAVFKKHNLHRERRPHNRLWPIAAAITYWFDGDPRLIWGDGSAFNTLCRLYWIGAGEQISRMIVGALKDCKIVSGKGDPKADVRVCRVIGRCILGEAIDPVNAFAAIRICREICPSDPWELDGPLWQLGEETCKDGKPDCGNCYLRVKCASFGKGPLRDPQPSRKLF